LVDEAGLIEMMFWNAVTMAFGNEGAGNKEAR
jgi:hypothetical protein